MMVTTDELDRVLDEYRARWGPRLRRWREAASFTQDEFARIIGATQQDVSSWERGVSFPGDGRRIEIARALGIADPYDLFDFPYPPARRRGVGPRRDALTAMAFHYEPFTIDDIKRQCPGLHYDAVKSLVDELAAEGSLLVDGDVLSWAEGV